MSIRKMVTEDLERYPALQPFERRDLAERLNDIAANKILENIGHLINERDTALAAASAAMKR